MSSLRERFSGWSVVVVAATVAVIAWVGYELSQWPPPPAESDVAVAPATSPASSPDEATQSEPPKKPRKLVRRTVAVLSDGLIADPASWFQQTVAAGEIRGLKVGVQASQPGADTAAVATRLPDVAEAELVIVQAGTNDLLAGTSGQDTALRVIDLLQQVQETGAEVIWVTIPPSGAVGAEVIVANDAIRKWAEGSGVGVLDVYTPVADSDGTYADGFSPDGIQPAEAGNVAQAKAARDQLPKVVQAVAEDEPLEPTADATAG